MGAEQANSKRYRWYLVRMTCVMIRFTYQTIYNVKDPEVVNPG